MASKKKVNSNEEEEIKVIDAIRLLAKERRIDEEELIRAVESGIVTAYKREFSGSAAAEVAAEIDRETGEIFVYKLVEVVEEVYDPEIEISLAEAQASDPEVELGDQIEVGVSVSQLGRLAAQAAKSAISQKVRDAEANRVKSEFSGMINEVTSGTILRRDKNNIYVDVDSAEAILPREGKIRNEDYPTGKKMKFLVVGVEEHNGHPSVILSRTSNELVKKLFELEVPEIKNGEVVVMAVSREAGQRSKIAVMSRDENIDPKGSCVGQRGQRVTAVMQELGGEKIDIVDWNEDSGLFISEALQPAKVMRVDTEITTLENGEQERFARVIVPDDQFSLAIGKAGQNVRLAARLVGFKIDIKKESDELAENTQKMFDKFEVVPEEETEE